MVNQFYLHFRAPQEPESVRKALASIDPVADVSPVFDTGFLCAANMSFSAFTHAVKKHFPAGGYIVIKPKNGSVSLFPGNAPPEDL